MHRSEASGLTFHPTASIASRLVSKVSNGCLLFCLLPQPRSTARRVACAGWDGMGWDGLITDCTPHDMTMHQPISPGLPTMPPIRHRDLRVPLGASPNVRTAARC